MKKIEILGTGCPKCRQLAANAEQASTELGIEFTHITHDVFGTGAEGIVTQNFGIQQTDSAGDPVSLTGLSWSVIKENRFEALLNALSTDTNVSILSTPKVFTTSGKQATIDISTEVPFAKGQFVSEVGGGISTSFDYESVGIVLEVTPVVSQNGTVTMEVRQTADELLRFEPLAPNLQLPVVSKRLAEATVSVSDGDTVGLGGLMSDRVSETVTGIPVLKDLPLLGWLFRNKDTTKEKTELLVFLTPKVVRGPEECEMLTEEQKGLSRNMPLPATPVEP